MGPEIDTAATTRPDGPRTGAETDATPGSRSPTLCAHPRRRTTDSAVAVNAGALQTPVQPVGFLPRQQHLSGGSGEHGQAGTDRDGVAQPDRPVGGRDANALVTLATEQLGALVGVVAQGAQDRSGGREQPVLTGRRGQLAQPRPKDEPALHVSAHQPVVLQRDGEAVRRRPRQPSGRDQLGQGRRPGFQRTEHRGRLVENADPARVVHVTILPSQ